jgi:predicted ATPase
MTITRIKLDHFTAFKSLDMPTSPGINILIGANGTGKTHVMKAAYAACDVSRTGRGLAEKLVATFMPYEDRLGRLAHRTKGSTNAHLQVHRESAKISTFFSNHSKGPETAKTTGVKKWSEQRIECAYIPVKEMLANAPGFRSLYAARQIHFEEIYADIVDRAYAPPLKGPPDPTRKKLLASLHKSIEGKVEVIGETFFLHNKHGKLEFSLLAEGMRKLALLWKLIQNGTLQGGSVLFWDEPESNLNPKIMRTLAEILLVLQRLGVQIFLATHDYVLLKEFDLLSTPTDNVAYHALFRDLDDTISHERASTFNDLHHNVIAETFTGLYDRDVARAFESHGKR